MLRNFARCLLFPLTVAGTLLGVSVVESAQVEHSIGGPVVKGLRLSLQIPSRKEGDKTPRICLIRIENVGERDLNVRLGISLNNGRSHRPEAIQLIATAKGQRARRLIYFDGLGGVGARVDPFVVPLPVGAGYTLPFPLNRFVTPGNLEPLDLSAGEYQVEAELTGTPITENDVNLDTKGQVLIVCWEGTIRSNPVQHPLAGKVPPEKAKTQ
jgi:hypothetical protein